MSRSSARRGNPSPIEVRRGDVADCAIGGSRLFRVLVMREPEAGRVQVWPFDWDTCQITEIPTSCVRGVLKGPREPDA
jgi:hypothetical protein